MSSSSGGYFHQTATSVN